ncbi:hypothetical protein MA16_Dca024594 [Dendrobium catenatum]|uniref:Uncharacterized protein n=1 Tax=Dendrobium catenatum TaxID=906689 RepID=A0A2I0X314_9ASPA|nr:hypothetical protein MA16_Dca024594 [Dendrobium catenatum]
MPCFDTVSDIARMFEEKCWCIIGYERIILVKCFWVLKVIIWIDQLCCILSLPGILKILSI